jgi:hypothetical protein
MRIQRTKPWRLFAPVFVAVWWSPAFGDAGSSGSTAPDHGAFQALLETYASPAGVRYRAWSENETDRSALRAYLVEMSEVRPSEIGRDDALAFWINVYNAVTLDLVLEHYPLESIKDVGGFLSSPWKKKLITIEGEELSLNGIENDVIRQQFQEPRIHFALNCASKSCPPLRAEAYSGERLDGQLEEQTALFVGNLAENTVDEKGRLQLSKIFDWYGEDFEKAAGSVADYVRPYIPALSGRDLREVSIRHGDYDWALNEVRE